MSYEDPIRELTQLAADGHPLAAFELVAMDICPRCAALALDFAALGRSAVESLVITCRNCRWSMNQSINDDFDIPNPESAISQSDLFRLLSYRQTNRQLHRLRDKIKISLLSNAKLAPGPLTARLETTFSQPLSMQKVKMICGAETANQLRRNLPRVPQRTILIGMR